MTGFDRVRPRTPHAASAPAAPPAAVDAEGKRALFTSAADVARPGVGSALVECSRCQARTVLGPVQAIRATFPSLHLALRVGHGDEVKAIGIGDREYPAYLKCPSCHRPSWVRFTWQI
ncbi:MAG TPA: hypothetical protein VG708_10695 [Mycobacteriales bacterium]|nr:hypothetical protein [Mycobacteriales bacterium]